MSDEIFEQYVREFKEKWVALDGLALLAPRQVRTPYPGHSLLTASNDNGIYFLAIAFLLIHKTRPLLIEEKDWLKRALNELYSDGFPTSRNPGRVSESEIDLNSFDNFIGELVCDLLAGSSYRYEMRAYYQEHGPFFDNRNPDNPSPRSIQRPSDVFCYKAAWGDTPGMMECIWFIGGIILTLFDKSDSNQLVTWVRYELLDLAQETERPLPHYQRKLVAISRMIWEAKVDLLKAFQNFFHSPERNLYRMIAEEVLSGRKKQS